MRKSQITVVVTLPLEKEAATLTTIVTFLQAQKTAGNVDKATVETQEVELPVSVTI